MVDHGLVGKLDQWLGKREGLLLVRISGSWTAHHLASPETACWRPAYQRAQPGAEAADENEGCRREISNSIRFSNLEPERIPFILKVRYKLLEVAALGRDFDQRTGWR